MVLNFLRPGSSRLSITHWKVKHMAGAVQYHNSQGTIEIKIAGYYFIYSQMYYYDGSPILMAHHTFINNDKVMESVGSVISDTKMFNTKYHGGVFLLQANDTISVGVPYTKKYYMDEEGSFFGAFLIHPIE